MERPGHELVDGRRLSPGGFTRRQTVYLQSWPAVGTHTIRIVVAGTAVRPRVDLDAFAISQL